MSLLFEPSATSFLFEPEANDEQLFVSEFLDLLEGSWPTTEIPPQEPAFVISDPPRSALKRLRPRSTGDTDPAPSPKRSRRPSAARPRLRNKGKIELLKREIQTLEAELDALQHAGKCSPGRRHTESLWKIVAMKQSRERERAEYQNKALKSLLGAQYKLTTSLSGVLSELESAPIPDTILI